MLQCSESHLDRHRAQLANDLKLVLGLKDAPKIAADILELAQGI